MIDLNVVLDVVQSRDEFEAASAQVLHHVIDGDVVGCLAAHALTTLHYIVGRHASRAEADEIVDWALRHFEIVPETRETFLHARTLDFKDFEDATVAASAAHAGCRAVVTRNVGDFKSSPVEIWSPEDSLEQLSSISG